MNRMCASTLGLFVVSLCACNVGPLRWQDLRNGDRDAGVDAAPLTPASADAADRPCPPCAADSYCEPATATCEPKRGTGAVSGVVISACDGSGVAALVGIAGRHQCSFPSKGSFDFSALPAGTTRTLAAAAPRYKTWSEPVAITASGVANVRIELAPVEGCATPPPPPMCSCALEDCVTR